MLKVFVDSGCSIKQEETEKYGIELIPLKILLGDKEYRDGKDLPIDEFYKFLIEDKGFPKTSLPDLLELSERVKQCLSDGDDVIILTLSSQISGTFDAIRTMFKDEQRVRVLDSKIAVGGMRLIIDEINRHRNETLDDIERHVNALIPRIVVMAIPETLTYLHRGGRLSKTAFVIGNMLNIKPIIGFKEGKVTVIAKKMGLRSGISYIANALTDLQCDSDYEIIASYTYDRSNLDELITSTDERYLEQIKVYDNLDPAIACHWGPNAFGYVFVSKK